MPYLLINILANSSKPQPGSRGYIIARQYFLFLSVSLFLILAVGNSFAMKITDDLEAMRIRNVGYSWKTVSFQNTYTTPVIVCAYNLPSDSDNEAVVRVRNAGSNSFQVMIQRPADSNSVTAGDVYCIVADEGDYTLPSPDGRVFEAHSVTSDGTSGWALGWGSGNTEDVSLDIDGSYRSSSTPVILGQVMTFYDSDFSAFWSFDCDNRRNVPFQSGIGDGICVGKHIGQINDTRADETLGYIVIADRRDASSGSTQPTGSFNGINYRVALGGDSIRGVGNSPPYSYSVGATYDMGAATQEAEDGGQGGWAVLFGADPLSGNEIDLAIDEETVAGDTSRQHTTEQVGYWLFRGTDHGDAPSSYGDASHYVTGGLSLGLLADVSSDPDAESSALSNTTADGDDTDNLDDEDGVTFRSPAGTNHSIYADVVVNNVGGDSVTVCGWLDLPSGTTGSFESSDVGFVNGVQGCFSTTSTNPTITFQWSGLPIDSQYTTYARFRISTDSFSSSNPTGNLSDGEVEDYQVIFDFRPTAVTIGKVELEATRVPVFLDGLGVEEMDNQVLLTLLRAWDPVSAASIPSNAGRGTILAALQEYLDPDGDDQVAVFSWETLEERGTIGFFVDRRQAEQNAWTRINNDMLPGLINAPMGGEYKLADPGAVSGSYQYRLIEQEARGTMHSYGPFEVKLP